MNPDAQQLLAAIVSQHMEMGEKEWGFDPRPFLSVGEKEPMRVSSRNESKGPIMAGKKKTEEIPCCDPGCTNADALAGKNSLDELAATVQDCLRCQLGEKRTKFVFGSGNPHADVMFVGEAPGAEEDLQGLPFVGRAGQLLTKMIESIKFSREDVYITNVLKCRPPGNRDPLPAEIEKCEPILIRQIELIQPKVICALGRISGQTLLRTNATLGALRGRVHDYHGVKLIVTYHPAALLRNPDWKRPAWEDLKFLRREYDGVEL